MISGHNKNAADSHEGLSAAIDKEGYLMVSQTGSFYDIFREQSMKQQESTLQ